jgi:hypothetical protein
MTNTSQTNDTLSSPVIHKNNSVLEPTHINSSPVGDDLTTLSRDELVLKLHAAHKTIEENGRGI